MTMVKDSLQKAYANDGINKPEDEDEDTSYDEESNESVDPVDGEKPVKAHHVVEVNGELRGETVDQFDQDDPEIKHYMGVNDGKDGVEEGDEENDDEDDSEESQYDPELLGIPQGAHGEDPSQESFEENFDSRLKKLQEEEDLSDEEEKLEGSPLVDKKQLEQKALEILNRKIDSMQVHHKQVSTKSEVIERINRRKVEIESSKKTRESIPNSILISIHISNTYNRLNHFKIKKVPN